MYGGSGGATTEGVFKGIAYSGILTVLFCISLTIKKWNLVRLKWYLIALILFMTLLGIMEASILNW